MLEATPRHHVMLDSDVVETAFFRDFERVHTVVKAWIDPGDPPPKGGGYVKKTDVAIRILGCGRGISEFVSDERMGRDDYRVPLFDYPTVVSLVAGIRVAR